MAYIYKITNLINNKIYIGKTYKTIEKRFQEHILDSRKKTEEHRPLYSAMRKYGIENFKVELIEETNNPEEREQYWIEYYNSYHNGYNATKGGDGKAYIDRQEVLNLWNQGLLIKEIHNQTGRDEKQISLILSELGVSKEEKEHRRILFRGTPVGMFDLKTDEFLMSFESASAAARYMGRNYPWQISDVCKNKRLSAYGYKWKYLDK